VTEPIKPTCGVDEWSMTCHR